jgi:hypothetical protein
VAPQLDYAYFGDIVKTEKTADGLMVTGKAAGPDLDLDGQRCDPMWLKTAMPEWFKWGNVREQHSTIAAGVGREMTEDGDDWYIKALIVDPNTIKKIETGVLKGFSIGIKNGQVVRSKAAPNGVINGGIVAEVSTVDRPCNPTAMMSIAKSVDGATLLPVDEDGEVQELEEPEPPATPLLDKMLKGVTTQGVLEPDDEPEGDEPDDDAGHGDALVVEPDMPASEYRKALRLVSDVLDGTVINKALAADGTIDETADIEGAKRIVSLMADLVISEARELKAGRMAELRDIETLMQACRSMYSFIANEGYQHGSRPPGAPEGMDEMPKAVEPDITKRDFSAKQREQAAESGAAMPDGSFPIKTAEDLENAVGLWGNAKNPDAAKAHIISRARALGLVGSLPDSWNVGDKAATIDIQSEITKAVTAATAEVTSSYEARLATVQAQLTKVLATEIPGGPVIFPVQPPVNKTVVSDSVSKAAYYRQIAERTSDPGIAQAYRELATKVESA